MEEIVPDVVTLSGDEKKFLLRVVQPGLAGLMDGSVSTLAPIFATAFATRNSHTVFLIGAAAAVGAGISMAFSEGLSDDGELTGRGNPIFRGLVTGGMTFVGGFLHTAAVSDPQRAYRADVGLSGGRRGVAGHLLDSAPLFQERFGGIGAAGSRGWWAGVCGGSADRAVVDDGQSKTAAEAAVPVLQGLI